MNKDHLFENANIANKISIPDLNFVIKVSGNGMQPKYSNGDMLLCKKATDDLIIQWGKTYVIYTKDQKITARRLLPSDKEGYIKLATYNDDKPPFELEKDQIVDYYIAIASIIME